MPFHKSKNGREDIILPPTHSIIIIKIANPLVFSLVEHIKFSDFFLLESVQWVFQ